MPKHIIHLSQCQRNIVELGKMARIGSRSLRIPIIPYFAFISSLLSCVLIWFDPTQRVALYYTIPFVAICYVAHYLWRRKNKKFEVVEE